MLHITVCVQDRRPLLAQPTTHDLLRRCWAAADRWLVGRYIIMPDHLHMFCSPADPGTSLKTWMEFWRASFTRQWTHAADKPIWQKEFWDTQLRHGESYAAKWVYVRNNAVASGLVTDADAWPFQGEMNVLPWIER